MEKTYEKIVQNPEESEEEILKKLNSETEDICK